MQHSSSTSRSIFNKDAAAASAACRDRGLMNFTPLLSSSNSMPPSSKLAFLYPSSHFPVFPLFALSHPFSPTPNRSFSNFNFNFNIIKIHLFLEILPLTLSPSHAILLFYQFRNHNLCPDAFTCYFLLNACVDLLDKMPHRDVVTWNTIITHLVKRGGVDSEYNMFVERPERNFRSWTAMIAGFSQCGKPKLALDLFTEMKQVGLKPTEVTVVAVLAAYADLGALDLGTRMH